MLVSSYMPRTRPVRFARRKAVEGRGERRDPRGAADQKDEM